MGQCLNNVMRKITDWSGFISWVPKPQARHYSSAASREIANWTWGWSCAENGRMKKKDRKRKQLLQFARVGKERVYDRVCCCAAASSERCFDWARLAPGSIKDTEKKWLNDCQPKSRNSRLWFIKCLTAVLLIWDTSSFFFSFFFNPLPEIYSRLASSAMLNDPLGGRQTAAFGRNIPTFTAKPQRDACEWNVNSAFSPPPLPCVRGLWRYRSAHVTVDFVWNWSQPRWVQCLPRLAVIARRS